MNKFEIAFAEAKEAAKQAFDECQPVPMVVGEPSTPFGNDVDMNKPVHFVADGVCGFAWVNVYADRRKPEGKALKEAGVKWDDYRKAFSIWADNFVPGAGQGMQRKAAACQAAARVFREHGYRAYADERID